MNSNWIFIVWVLGASILGFAISAIFSGWLQMSRRKFLVPYITLTAAFLLWFYFENQVDLLALLKENLIWGLVIGGGASLFLVRNVRSQPISRQTKGGALVFDLAWLGLAYGFIDALFLNVMPVLAVLMSFSQGEFGATWLGKFGIGALALFASLLVTLTYHLGYIEFRSRRVGLVLVGNAIITMAYLVSGNPLGAILSHTLMHVAATIQGPETTIQLPPHNHIVAEI